MAGLFFYLKPAAPITVTTGAGPLTWLQLIAPSSHRVLVHELDVSFNGITAADPPVLLELLIQTTAGSGGTSLTPVPYDASYDETIQSTALHTITTTPTAGSIKWSEYVHTQTGIIRPFPKPIVVPGGTRFGLQWTTGTVTGTVKVTPCMLCEE